MLSEYVRERQIRYDLTHTEDWKNPPTFIGTGIRFVVITGGDLGREEKLEDGGQNEQTSSCKINKYWGHNVQHDDSS